MSILRLDALNLFGTLSTIKVNKMEGDLVEAVLNNHLALNQVRKSYDELTKMLSEKVLEGISQDRQQAHSELENKLKAEKDEVKQAQIRAAIYDNYSDIIKANQVFQKVNSKLLNASVSVNLTQVDRKEFMKACEEAKVDITTNMLTTLSPMFKGVDSTPVDIKALEDELSTLLEEEGVSSKKKAKK